MAFAGAGGCRRPAARAGAALGRAPAAGQVGLRGAEESFFEGRLRPSLLTHPPKETFKFLEAL